MKQIKVPVEPPEAVIIPQAIFRLRYGHEMDKIQVFVQDLPRSVCRLVDPSVGQYAKNLINLIKLINLIYPINSKKTIKSKDWQKIQLVEFDYRYCQFNRRFGNRLRALIVRDTVD